MNLFERKNKILTVDDYKKYERRNKALNQEREPKPSIYVLAYDKHNQTSEFKEMLVERILELDLKSKLESPVESTISIKTDMHNSYARLLGLFDQIIQEGEDDDEAFNYVLTRVHEIETTTGKRIYAIKAVPKEPLNSNFIEMVENKRKSF